MTKDKSYARFIGLLAEKESFAVVLAGNASYDGVAAGMALYFALLRAGKDAVIISDTPVREDMGILGLEKLTKSLTVGGNTLVISFPYKDGAVDRVSYKVEDDFLKVIVKPKEGCERIDSNSVRYEYTGGKPQVIVTIEAPTLDTIGKVYSENREMFSGPVIVNIDRRKSNVMYGNVNIVKSDISSTSEIILDIIKGANLEIDDMIATNLLVGIIFATANFSSTTFSADTLESAAFLMKKGAKRKNIVAAAQGVYSQLFSQQQFQQKLTPQFIQQGQSQGYQQAPFIQQPYQYYSPIVGVQQGPYPKSQYTPPATYPQQVQQTTPFVAQKQNSQSFPQENNVLFQQQINQKKMEEETTTKQKIDNLQNIIAEEQSFPQELVENKEVDQKAPSEWLKPKIFKSGSSE